MPHALQFLVLVMSGWLNRRQQSAIEYLPELRTECSVNSSVDTGFA